MPRASRPPASTSSPRAPERRVRCGAASRCPSTERRVGGVRGPRAPSRRRCAAAVRRRRRRRRARRAATASAARPPVGSRRVRIAWRLRRCVNVGSGRRDESTTQDTARHAGGVARARSPSSRARSARRGGPHRLRRRRRAAASARTRSSRPSSAASTRHGRRRRARGDAPCPRASAVAAGSAARRAGPARRTGGAGRPSRPSSSTASVSASARNVLGSSAMPSPNRSCRATETIPGSSVWSRQRRSSGSLGASEQRGDEPRAMRAGRGHRAARAPPRARRGRRRRRRHRGGRASQRSEASACVRRASDRAGATRSRSVGVRTSS